MGRLRGDQFRVAGETYYMNQHGFARNMLFDVVEQSENKAVFRIVDSESTHRVYPFKFQLDISYELTEDDTLHIAYIVHNPDKEETLFFSVGGHRPLICHLMEESFRTTICQLSLKIYDRVRLVGPYSNPNHPTPFNASIPLRLRQKTIMMMLLF